MFMVKHRKSIVIFLELRREILNVHGSGDLMGTE